MGPEQSIAFVNCFNMYIFYSHLSTNNLGAGTIFYRSLLIDLLK